MSAPEHIVTAFQRAAEAHGDAVAVIGDDQSLTYRELVRSVRAVAAALPPPASDRSVAVTLAPHGADSLIGWLAALEAGYVSSVMDSHGDPDAIVRHLQVAPPDAVITGRDGESIAAHVAPELRAVPVADVTAAAGSLAPAAAPPLDPLRPAVLVFTSGTTGRPRAVLHGSRAMVHNATVNVRDLGLTPHDRALWTASMTTISGISDALRMLLHGGSLVPADLRRLSLAGAIERIRRYEATVVHVVPTVFRRLVRVAEPSDLATVRIVHLGGEPITRSDVGLFAGRFGRQARFVANLGSSEVPSFRRSIVDADAAMEQLLVPLRHAVDGKETLLLDQQGHVVEDAGVPGEIVVDTAFGALEYWGEADLTSERFMPRSDGRMRYLTGDVGRWTREGSLQHLGRLDRMRKVGGAWVDASVVEAAVVGRAGVNEAVAGWLDDDGAAVLTVSVTGNGSLDAAALQRDLASTLAPQEIPRRIHIASSFPTLDNGKVDRSAVLAAVPTVPPDVGRSSPETSTELRLVAIWREVLSDAGRPHPSSSFIEDGGDSLAALELRHRVVEEFGVEIDTETIFTEGTLRAIAGAIDSGATGVSTVHVQRSVHRNDANPDVWCVGDHRPMVAVIDRLGERARVAHFRIDGLQTEVPLGLDVRDQVSAYREEADALGLPAPIGIVGFSYGGLLAYELAVSLRRNGEFAPLLMIEPAVPGQTGAVTHGRQRWFGRVRRWVRPGEAHDDHRWRAYRPIMAANVIAYEAPSLDGDVWIAGRKRYLRRTGRAWQRLVPRASLVEVGGSTHTSIATGPDAGPWLSVVEGWLERSG